MSELPTELVDGVNGRQQENANHNADLVEDQDNARPPPPAILQGEVSLDTPPLSYKNDLNEVEQQAFDSCEEAMDSCCCLKSALAVSRLQVVLSYVRGLVLQYPKIAKVRKTQVLTFGSRLVLRTSLLSYATDILNSYLNPDQSMTMELCHFLIENCPSALFWKTSYENRPILCVQNIIRTRGILWLAEHLPSVLERAYEIYDEIYQEGRGGFDIDGLSPSLVSLGRYTAELPGSCLIPIIGYGKHRMSASQLLQYFDKYPQGLGENIYHSELELGRELKWTLTPLLYFIRMNLRWSRGIEDFRDEHFQILKFMASKRPELLCSGEFSVVLTAMHWMNIRAARNGTHDQPLSFIKILVRACPVSIMTEGRSHADDEDANRPPTTPFDSLQSNSRIANHIRDDLMPFFDRTKECLDRKAVLEADLSLVREVLDKVKVIDQIHSLDERTKAVFGGENSAYQEWATTVFFRRYDDPLNNVFHPIMLD